MIGIEGAEAPQFGQQFLGDPLRPAVARPAMRDAVSNRSKSLKSQPLACQPIEQLAADWPCRGLGRGRVAGVAAGWRPDPEGLRMSRCALPFRSTAVPAAGRP